MNELYDISALELIRLFKRRAVSPVEVTKAVLARIQAWEPKLNAVFEDDAQSALAMARASEARWQKGEPAGALDGLPLSIKDNLAISGRISPVGNKLVKLAPAAGDCPPVARMREAGAVFICRTTMPDFGMLISGRSSLHGITRNPWNLQRNPGGSSSGAGAAAAAGYGPLHLGTDIAGSVRLPASWCGVFGFKPSHGRVPVAPPYIGRVTGPLTRTVTDAALMMGVLSAPDVRDYMSLPPVKLDWNVSDVEPNYLHGKRIGLWLDAGPKIRLNPEVRAAVESAAAVLRDAGASVDLLPRWFEPSSLIAYHELLGTRLKIDIRAAKAGAAFGEEIPKYLCDWCNSVSLKTAEDMLGAVHTIFQLRADTIAATSSFDFIVSPTAAVPAIAAENYTENDEPNEPLIEGVFAQPFNLSEQPAASINCGYTVAGLPIGLQIVGRRFDDVGVLRLARVWERIRGPQKEWPEPGAS